MAEAIAIDIGKSLAIEAAKALTQLVGARPLEEIRFAWGFKDQLRTINRKFGYIRAFLEDLGSAKSEQKGKLLNLWLQNVKDLVYSAEDFMDEYANEILRRRLEQSNGSRKHFRNVFKRSNRIRFRFRMTHKVGEILAKFEELEKEAQTLGLKLVKVVEKALALTYNDNMDQHLQQVREHADADASEFVGRKLDEEKLVQLLCSPPPPSNKDYSLSINAIVGMGGIGKTTLARRLYTNDQVVRQFSKLFWICVSDDFDITRILKKLSEFLTRKCELSNADAIIAQIHRELNGNKFLLVLDDVWNNNVELWDSLKRSLQKIGGLPGSAILLTTRSSEVATKAGVDCPHLLTKLSEEESWALFKQHFNTRETLLHVPCFEDVGRRIVEKCKGVPLAIKMIGRTLQSKKELYEWEKIEESDLWHLEQDNILPWLKLSFYHLPSLSLKQCFAYCAIFPKDCSMERGDLIALWLAQGFLHKPETSNSTMEEIGEGILEILMQNLFLQGEESEKTGRILSYRMHDLVHDLAVYVSRKDLLVWKEEAKPNNAIECRHLVGKFRMKQAVPEFPAEIYPQKLRTINLWAGFLKNLSEARYLRTLIIDDIGLQMVPTAIGQLKLLRYLDLSNNPIKSIPESITKLYQLQTLKLTGCKQLTELPTEMHRLVNIRHILTADQSLFASKGLQQLTCLQTLPSLALRNEEGWAIEELGFLHEAKDGLSISGLEHVKSEAEARKAGLSKKGKLLRLHFVWSANREASSSSNSNRSTDEEVLNGLEPHPGIISLALVNYNAEKFPLWIMRMAVKYGEPRKKLSPLGNLKAIKLVDCKRCRQLPTLGQLPFLKYLYVDTLAVESIDEDFYVSDQDSYKPREQLFPTLRELQIWNLPNLIEWKKPPPTIEATAFPCLEILEVINCPLLNTIPALTFKSLTRLRIQELAGTQSLDIVSSSSKLTSLEVCDIGKMSSLPQEVSNFTNLQKLNIWSCKELVSLPSGLQFLVFLKALDIRQCPALVSLPDDLFQGLSSLYKLSIFRCMELKRIPTSLQGCTSLKELYIKHCPLVEAPLPDLKMLQGLEDLGVVEAGKLTTSILEALKHQPRLTELNIGGFKDEQEFSNNFVEKSPFLTNPSLGLTRLMLEGTPHVKSLPEQIQLFSAIQFLGIKDFDELEQVPDWIGKLSSLEELWLSKCINLKLLPSKQVMQPLTEFWHLGIDGCPLLTERYTRDGPEWHNISHLSFIEFEGKTIQIKERR